MTVLLLLIAFDVALVALIFVRWPRCPECRAYDPMGRGPLGVWWHDDSCSRSGPPRYPDDVDDE